MNKRRGGTRCAVGDCSASATASDSAPAPPKHLRRGLLCATASVPRGGMAGISCLAATRRVGFPRRARGRFAGLACSPDGLASHSRALPHARSGPLSPYRPSASRNSSTPPALTPSPRPQSPGGEHPMAASAVASMAPSPSLSSCSASMTTTSRGRDGAAVRPRADCAGRAAGAGAWAALAAWRRGVASLPPYLRAGKERGKLGARWVQAAALEGGGRSLLGGREWGREVGRVACWQRITRPVHVSTHR